MEHYAPKVGGKFLPKVIILSYNHKDLTTFAVIFVSFFIVMQEKPDSGIGCRSPSINLDF